MRWPSSKAPEVIVNNSQGRYKSPYLPLLLLPLPALLLLMLGSAARAEPEAGTSVVVIDVDVYTHHAAVLPGGPERAVVWLPETNKKGELQGRVQVVGLDEQLQRRWIDLTDAPFEDGPPAVLGSGGDSFYALWVDAKGKKSCVDGWKLEHGDRRRACVKSKWSVGGPLSLAVVDGKPWVCGQEGANLGCKLFNVAAGEAFDQVLLKKSAKNLVDVDQMDAHGRLDSVHRGNPFGDEEADLTMLSFGRAGDRGEPIPLKGSEGRVLLSAHRAPQSAMAEVDRDLVVGMYAEGGSEVFGIYTGRLGKGQLRYLPFERFPTFARIMESLLAENSKERYVFLPPRFVPMGDDTLVVVEAARPTKHAVAYAGYPSDSPLAGKAVGPVELLPNDIRAWAQILDFPLDQGPAVTNAFLIAVSDEGRPLWWKDIAVRAPPAPTPTPYAALFTHEQGGTLLSGAPSGIESRQIDKKRVTKGGNLDTELTRAEHWYNDVFIGWRYEVQAARDGSLEGTGKVYLRKVKARTFVAAEEKPLDDEVVR